MSRYLILLPAPEAEWAALPPEEHEKGPFARNVERIAGSYQIRTDGHDGLVRCCAQLASTGDFIELRKLADDGENRSGQPSDPDQEA